jgi:hypothetical protein
MSVHDPGISSFEVADRDYRGKKIAKTEGKICPGLFFVAPAKNSINGNPAHEDFFRKIVAPS